MSYFNWIVQRFKDNPAGAAFAGPLNSPAAYMLKLDGLAESVGPQMLQSWLNKESGAGLTQQQIEENAYTAQREDTFWQRGTEDMQKAGVNPALLYGKGVQPTASPASSASASAGGSLSNMLELLALPLQLRQIRAVIENTEADTRLKSQKTLTEEQVTKIKSIAAEFGEELTVLSISEAKARIDKLVADTGFLEANTDYINSKKEAQDIVNTYIDESERARIDELKERGAEEHARAWYTNIQASFANKNGFLMSSNDSLLLATYIASLFGVTKDSVMDGLNGIIDKLRGKKPNSG